MNALFKTRNQKKCIEKVVKQSIPFMKQPYYGSYEENQQEKEGFYQEKNKKKFKHMLDNPKTSEQKIVSHQLRELLPVVDTSNVSCDLVDHRSDLVDGRLLDLSADINEILSRIGLRNINKSVRDEQFKSLVLTDNIQSQVIGGCMFKIFTSVEHNFVELAYIVIQKKYQTAGLGKVLIDRLKQLCTQMQLKSIVTFADNRAVKFFKKQGFTFELGESRQQQLLKVIERMNYAQLAECTDLRSSSLLQDEKLAMVDEEQSTMEDQTFNSSQK